MNKKKEDSSLLIEFHFNIHIYTISKYYKFGYSLGSCKV